VTASVPHRANPDEARTRALSALSCVVAANGTATTATAKAVDAGTYSWKVTFTGTNPNYTGAATTCTAAQSDEKAVISYAGNSPIN